MCVFGILIKSVMAMTFIKPEVLLKCMANLIETSSSIFINVFHVQAFVITQAYLVIFDNGGGNLERDFSSARAFEMLSA